MVFNKILGAIAGDYNQRQLNKLAPIVKKINEIDKEWDALSDEQIKAKTPEFKQRLKKGETLDDILPEAFATVKQACKRMKGNEYDVKGQKQVWDMVPYDVQLLGGIVLHNGRIAEMKTGEGKTLVATLPVYLNALEWKGVHVVTVNDYLASRDSEWMGHLYEWLGLSSGSVVKGTPIQGRRDEYAKDITYVENSELGFDYLRDNLTRSLSERNVTRRPLNFAIVDEVDSILIDEARTPLIISQPSADPTEKYDYYSKIVRTLTPCSQKKKTPKGFLAEVLKKEDEQVEDGDYYIDEKNKNVTLSGQGIEKLEKTLGVENLYKDFGFDEIHHIENALKAQACYHNNKDYIVHDGEILIVDEHTGRTMPWRRYSEGLHQAIEAKEGVTIQRESQTLATITYQNFFKQYNKLAGMTGTATTEGEEFEKIYDLEVLSIPTNRPIIRADWHDKVYFNQNAKWKAVVDAIKFYHDAGVPILIGTSSIHTSELVSEILRKIQVQHYVLNAKFHEKEAEIVSNAGKSGSVVVATNMAWRGTDIKLEKWLNEKIATNYIKWIDQTLQWNTFGKVAPHDVKATVFSEREFDFTIEAMKQTWGLSDEQIRTAEQGILNVAGKHIEISFNKAKKIPTQWFAKIHVKAADGNTEGLVSKNLHYGLFILGTEKHESRRIDNQLRGRAWRQGDPGMSVFYVALDDEIMRKMGGERIQSVAGMLLSREELENLELTQKQFSSSIIRAQKQMEGWNFSIRKHLFDYDSVINKQRQRIYTKRDEMLELEEKTPNYMILHGFEWRPDANFIPWLKKELEAKGGIVLNPPLPNPDEPNVEEQISFIVDNAKFNVNTILVWHSLGAVVAMKALERKGVKIRKLVLLSGFTWPDMVDGEIVPFFQTFDWKFDFAKMQSLADEIVVIQDKNDTDVPPRAGKHLAEQLNVEPIMIDAKEEHICAAQEPEILPYIAVETKQSTTSTIAEIRAFIEDVVEGIVKKYENAQMDLKEVVETIKQDFGFDTLPINTEKVRAIKDLKGQLIDSFETYFDRKIAGIDPRAMDATLRMIYLAMIDKYWIQHIDDMQYLRDKVGLYGYAQQDPLVIYKKEAFEKFQQLMFNIKQETIAVVFRSDFRGPETQAMIRTQDQQNDQMLERLHEASQDVPEFTPNARRAQPMPQNATQAKQQQYANAFAQDDGVEVVEMPKQQAPIQHTEKKYGRNDLVTVISPDGKEEEMKYKKAEPLLAQGWRVKN